MREHPRLQAAPLTAVVHLANNLFKLGLMGKHADRAVVLRLGLPVIVAALAGAWLLTRLAGFQPLFAYRLADRSCEVTLVKLVVAVLMIGFALFELLPRFEKLSFDWQHLPLGGRLSGFFGGLSGHQGALRSPFLIKCGLSKESFIGTGVVVACLVDVSRLSLYSVHFATAGLSENLPILGAATVAAFFGAFLGSRLLKKVELRAIQVLVAILLFGIAIGLGSGLI